MLAYKRDFGKQTPHTSTANVMRCATCGCAWSLIAKNVLLCVTPGVGADYVCQKVLCVHCGKIHSWKDSKGNQRPAFYVTNSNGKIMTEFRDFDLPRDLYETNEGKADVGLKVRLVAALLRLQVKEPKIDLFYLQDVLKEMQNDG